MKLIDKMRNCKVRMYSKHTLCIYFAHTANKKSLGVYFFGTKILQGKIIFILSRVIISLGPEAISCKI